MFWIGDSVLGVSAKVPSTKLPIGRACQHESSSRHSGRPGSRWWFMMLALRDTYQAVHPQFQGARHMVASKPTIHATDRRLRAFVQEVTATLLDGRRHHTPGLGTFSTCTRRATAERVTRKMAIFRASADLREYAMGGPPPAVSGSHAAVVSVIVEAMRSEHGIDVPLLGHMAVVPVPGKRPKLIFHGAQELNDALAAR
jgi:hypothetical protein